MACNNAILLPGQVNRAIKGSSCVELAATHRKNALNAREAGPDSMDVCCSTYYYDQLGVIQVYM